MNKYTSKLILRGDHTRRDGTKMVVLQAFLNGKRVRFSLNIYLSESEFDQDRQVAKTKESEKNRLVNAILAKTKSRVEEMFYSAMLNDQVLTPDIFLSGLDGKSTVGSFTKFLQKEIADEKDGKASSTGRGYQTMFKTLCDFQLEITFSEITFELIQNFDRFLKKKKLENNTIASMHRRLKKFVLLAMKKRKIKENPYQVFKFREIRTERDFLSAKEVNVLFDLYSNAEMRPFLRDTLRHFLFQIGTSVRYSDLKTLEKTDLENDMLIFAPVKTRNLKKVVKIPLSEMSKRMVEESECRGKTLFSVPVEQIMNRRLKEISEMAGFSKKVTTHTARHTYGYLFIAAGGAVEVLQKIMGHSDIKTTMIYTHIDTKQIREGVARLDLILRPELNLD